MADKKRKLRGSIGFGGGSQGGRVHLDFSRNQESDLLDQKFQLEQVAQARRDAVGAKTAAVAHGRAKELREMDARIAKDAALLEYQLEQKGLDAAEARRISGQVADDKREDERFITKQLHAQQMEDTPENREWYRSLMTETRANKLQQAKNEGLKLSADAMKGERLVEDLSSLAGQEAMTRSNIAAAGAADTASRAVGAEIAERESRTRLAEDAAKRPQRMPIGAGGVMEVDREGRARILAHPPVSRTVDTVDPLTGLPTTRTEYEPARIGSVAPADLNRMRQVQRGIQQAAETAAASFLDDRPVGGAAVNVQPIGVNSPPVNASISLPQETPVAKPLPTAEQLKAQPFQVQDILEQVGNLLNKQR